MNKALIKKLDTVFSQFIRLRDADEKGFCKCISCGKIQHWKDMDCGHYINRKHMSTRYDEKNCNAQCRSCNRFDEGNSAGYVLGLMDKYGRDIIEILLVKKMTASRMTDWDGEALLVYYKHLVKEYKKVKK